MKFSVIIPLYNKAPYVAKAIQSVLSQSFADYELIIVDDGSTDASAKTATEAIEGRENCRLIQQENAGVSTARNNGAAVSRGEYLCFLDADDWWDPRFLEEMSRLVEAFPDAGIYGTGYTIVNEARHKTRVAPVGVEAGFEKGYINYCQVYAKTMTMPLTSISVAIPRLVFDEMKGFEPHLKMAEDFDLWIRIVLKYKVVFLNQPLAFYNQDVDARHRAMGSLPEPQSQFAFCAGYLENDMKKDAELKEIVERVQIVCLKRYYLSREYHKQAKEVLEKIDLKPHLDKSYASYLRYLYWITVLEDKLTCFIERMRYGK